MGLNAECNRLVAGLQLRLEDMSIFLNFEVIYIRKSVRTVKTGTVESQKPE